MSYVYCHSACILCGRIFAFNPHRVPSTREITGEREPICKDCIEALNEKFRAEGQAEFTVHPDAYEPIPEDQL